MEFCLCVGDFSIYQPQQGDTQDAASYVYRQTPGTNDYLQTPAQEVTNSMSWALCYRPNYRQEYQLGHSARILVIPSAYYPILANFRVLHSHYRCFGHFSTFKEQKSLLRATIIYSIVYYTVEYLAICASGRRSCTIRCHYPIWAGSWLKPPYGIV